MAAVIHSKAVFKGQALEAGLDETSVGSLIANGIDTLSKLAFCSAFVPGQISDEPLVLVLTAALNGNQPSVGDLAMWRQLHFVAHTLTVAAVRQQADTGADSVVRGIPALERAERYAFQVAKLPNLRLTGELEASHQLLDQCVHQYDSNTLAYIHPEKATKREDELRGVKKLDIMLNLSGSTPRTIHQSEEQKTPLNADLQLQWAWQRRGLAYDQANLIDFSVHNDWTSFLLHLPYEEVPFGYAPPTREQLLRADQKLFFIMAEASRTGIVARPGQARPLDALLERMRNDSRVTFLLFPLPAGHRGGGGGSGGRPRDPPAPVLPGSTANAPAVAGVNAEKNKRLKEKKKLKLAELARLKNQTANKPRVEVIAPAATDPRERAKRPFEPASGSGSRKCRFFNLPSGCRFSAEDCRNGGHSCSKCNGAHSAAKCTAT
jgi:hypothetical protein